MFTGLIEEIGQVSGFKKNSNGAEIEIKCNIVLKDIRIGDSISIDGVCETVTEFGDNFFKAKISDETWNVTTFEFLKSGQFVNLERALTLNSRLGGHIVSGHVDTKAELLRVEKLSQFYNMSFKLPKEYIKYIVHKGSVTVNGISLTVASVKDDIFKIAIIPHTFENTTLKYLKVGALVNIETDIIGKYVEKMLLAEHNENNKESISFEFLKENGFV